MRVANARGQREKVLVTEKKTKTGEFGGMENTKKEGGPTKLKTDI